MIDIQLYRMRIGLHYALHCKVKGLKYLSSFELLIILSRLLIRSGDIELNPGPNLLESESDSITMDYVSISKYFSIVHYNIQSVSNKIDLIGAEISNFSVICLTETWLNDHTANDSISLDWYKFYRLDRGGDNHGGLCVYTKDNVFSRRRNDLELPNIESFGLKSLFIIENSSLVHFTDLQILLPKLCLLSNIQSVLPLIPILMMYLLQATLISIPLKMPLTKKFLLLSTIQCNLDDRGADSLY